MHKAVAKPSSGATTEITFSDTSMVPLRANMPPHSSCIALEWGGEEEKSAQHNTQQFKTQSDINLVAASGHQFSKISTSRAVFNFFARIRFIWTFFFTKEFSTLRPQFINSLTGQSRPLRPYSFLLLYGASFKFFQWGQYWLDCTFHKSWPHKITSASGRRPRTLCRLAEDYIDFLWSNLFSASGLGTIYYSLEIIIILRKL